MLRYYIQLIFVILAISVYYNGSGYAANKKNVCEATYTFKLLPEDKGVQITLETTGSKYGFMDFKEGDIESNNKPVYGIDYVTGGDFGSNAKDPLTFHHKPNAKVSHSYEIRNYDQKNSTYDKNQDPVLRIKKGGWFTAFINVLMQFEDNIDKKCNISMKWDNPKWDNVGDTASVMVGPNGIMGLNEPLYMSLKDLANHFLIIGGKLKLLDIRKLYKDKKLYIYYVGDDVSAITEEMMESTKKIIADQCKFFN